MDYDGESFVYVAEFDYTNNVFDSSTEYCSFSDDKGKIYCDALKGFFPDLSVFSDIT